MIRGVQGQKTVRLSSLGGLGCKVTDCTSKTIKPEILSPEPHT